MLERVTQHVLLRKPRARRLPMGSGKKEGGTSPAQPAGRRASAMAPLQRAEKQLVMMAGAAARKHHADRQKRKIKVENKTSRDERRSLGSGARAWSALLLFLRF